ncbi:hypothetical protein IWZ01DRAFT_490759 [Phyllosticta capitalensis]
MRLWCGGSVVRFGGVSEGGLVVLSLSSLFVCCILHSSSSLHCTPPSQPSSLQPSSSKRLLCRIALSDAKCSCCSVVIPCSAGWPRG